MEIYRNFTEQQCSNRPEVTNITKHRREDGGDIVDAGDLVLAEEHLRLPGHEVRRHELGAAEEHGDPKEQNHLQLPAAIVAHYLGRTRATVMDLFLNTLTRLSTSW